jgi:hypothetical protein
VVPKNFKTIFKFLELLCKHFTYMLGVGHNLQVLCCCQACTWWIYGCWALTHSDRFTIKLWHWNVTACVHTHTHTHKCCQYIRRIVTGGFKRKQHICALLITSQRHVFKRIERTTCDGWTWSVDGWSLKNHHLLPQFLKNNLPRTWCTTKSSYHVCLTLEILETITHAKRSLSCVLNSRDLGYKTYMHIIVWNVWNLLLPENEKYLNVCDTVMCLPGSKQEIASLVGHLLLLHCSSSNNNEVSRETKPGCRLFWLDLGL